jgi:hypothetical protein
MEFNRGHFEKKFRSPEEEKNFLQAEILKHEEALSREGLPANRDSILEAGLSRYTAEASAHVLDSSFQMPQAEIHTLVQNLKPEEHDAKISELLSVLAERGIKNTLSILEKLGDPHVEDDFHRFLVQYIKKGFPVKGLEPKTSLSKALHMTLYEVTLPDTPTDAKEKALKELISSMEQFYAGMLSISSEDNPRQNHMVLEIANSNGSDEFVFYVSVPEEKSSLFEKQILSVFNTAKVIERPDDHNIFNATGVSVGSVATATGNSIYPIKTYESFDHDPMNVILNSFSKIDRDGEGACMQVLISPSGDFYQKRYSHALEQIEKGVSIKDAINFPTGIGEEFIKTFGEIFKSSKKKDPEKEEKKTPPDPKLLERINTKMAKPIVNVSIRLVASADSIVRAESIISDIESGFNQFDDTQGNSLRFKRVKKGDQALFFRHFAFRSIERSECIPLNLSELTSIVHFHVGGLHGVSQLKTIKAGDAPAPLDLPKDGTLLGINSYRNINTNIFLTDEDRLRHIYTIGQTGTGKTTLLKNMIIQDIQKGNGVCMIDPHGSDILDVLAHIPKERLQDVIYFDPSYAARPMGLNMLEYDHSRPEQKTFVVNELFSIFQKLYGGVPESMGPMFEQYFRNATMLVIEDPETGCTLLDVSRVMSNKEFRMLKLSRCKNPIVVQFWTEIAEKAGGEGALANIVPYITSKFDVFLANDIMRPIIAQERSAFDFRDIMDNKKILLVNLAKGRLGDINANLLGLILVGKILMAALSRVDSIGASISPFYLYIDEFQNITTPSIATILSEARKYKLSLFIAHQFIAQLSDDIKNAVFGNVGNMAVYRIGADDAEYLAKQFEPVFTAQQIMNIDNFNFYVKMLVHGKPSKPFNIEASRPPEPTGIDISTIQELSYLKYGRNRDEVQNEVMKKYQKGGGLQE